MKLDVTKSLPEASAREESWNSLQVESPVLGSPLPPFEQLTTLIAPSTATISMASILKVYTRRRLGRCAQQAINDVDAKLPPKASNSSVQHLEDAGASGPSPPLLINKEEATSLLEP
jgi:hypothetical protein